MIIGTWRLQSSTRRNTGRSFGLQSQRQVKQRVTSSSHYASTSLGGLRCWKSSRHYAGIRDIILREPLCVFFGGGVRYLSWWLGCLLKGMDARSGQHSKLCPHGWAICGYTWLHHYTSRQGEKEASWQGKPKQANYRAPRARVNTRVARPPLERVGKISSWRPEVKARRCRNLSRRLLVHNPKVSHNGVNVTPRVIKVQVYSLVSSAKHHSRDFTQLPAGHGTCSFISHLISPGRIKPGCHFRRIELFKHTSLHSPTRYPLTPGSRERTCEHSALPRSTTSEHIHRSRGSNPRSLACKSLALPLSHDAPLDRWLIIKQGKRGQRKAVSESVRTFGLWVDNKHTASARVAAISKCLEDGQMKLPNRISTPIVGGACSQHRRSPLDYDMPVGAGLLGKAQVQVLQGTGRSSAAIRSGLVQPEQMTGDMHTCLLADGTQLGSHLPSARAPHSLWVKQMPEEAHLWLGHRESRPPWSQRWADAQSSRRRAWGWAWSGGSSSCLDQDPDHEATSEHIAPSDHHSNWSPRVQRWKPSEGPDRRHGPSEIVAAGQWRDRTMPGGSSESAGGSRRVQAPLC